MISPRSNGVGCRCGRHESRAAAAAVLRQHQIELKIEHVMRSFNNVTTVPKHVHVLESDSKIKRPRSTQIFQSNTFEIITIVSIGTNQTKVNRVLEPSRLTFSSGPSI